ncbi:futalosine hydrolase [Terrimonas pollutisoli]|uniref:futalosine hydrolase n=1 Tax=Terrimonas pollutisoli TaxID=3034147 RepID=UPI0023EB5C93|nr:futalosine hydrolase [Terrimonas sp. H1YJ31]
MTCLLVAATSFEISPFIESYRNSNNQFPGKHDLDILITGIGLTASTYSITKQINLKRPDIVIQAGVAGCFDRNIPLASVFTIRQDRIADLGVMEKNEFRSLFDSGLVPPDHYPHTRGWLVNKSEAFKKTKLKKVKAISVNEISTQKRRIKFYEESFDPVLESMEGAALHHVCLMEKIEFIQLRSVSNYVGERNKKNWKLQASINSLNIELADLLKIIAVL